MSDVDKILGAFVKYAEDTDNKPEGYIGRLIIDSVEEFAKSIKRASKGLKKEDLMQMAGMPSSGSGSRSKSKRNSGSSKIIGNLKNSVGGNIGALPSENGGDKAKKTPSPSDPVANYSAILGKVTTERRTKWVSITENLHSLLPLLNDYYTRKNRENLLPPLPKVVEKKRKEWMPKKDKKGKKGKKSDPLGSVAGGSILGALGVGGLLFGLYTMLSDESGLGMIFKTITKFFGFFTKEGKIGQMFVKISKGTGKLGTMFAKIGKIFAGTKALKFLKKIPWIGSAISVGQAIGRFNEGDPWGGAIDLVSAFANLFPGVGTAISIVIDLFQWWRDSSMTAEQRANLPFSDQMAKMGDFLLEKLNSWGSDLFGWIGDTVMSIGTYIFDMLPDSVKGFLASAKEKMTAWFNDRFLGGVIGKLSAHVEEATRNVDTSSLKQESAIAKVKYLYGNFGLAGEEGELPQIFKDIVTGSNLATEKDDLRIKEQLLKQISDGVLRMSDLRLALIGVGHDDDESIRQAQIAVESTLPPKERMAQIAVESTLPPKERMARVVEKNTQLSENQNVVDKKIPSSPMVIGAHSQKLKEDRILNQDKKIIDNSDETVVLLRALIKISEEMHLGNLGGLNAVAGAVASQEKGGGTTVVNAPPSPKPKPQGIPNTHSINASRNLARGPSYVRP